MNKSNQNEDNKIQYAKYKNAYLLKQNLYLNEKMIFQHYYDREFKELSSNPNFSRFYNENLYKPMSLDLSQKYDVVRSELKNANQKWEKFEKRKDELTDDLLAKNQEIIQNTKDIKMEVYDLNRKIDIQSDNPKSGKILSEVFFKFFDEKFKKMENLKKKLVEQNENLLTQIRKAREKIENKDNSNDLEFIDFHQLQIENKKYVKEVDEKNKLLLKLKMTIGKISQDKNKLKEQLTKKINELSDHQKTTSSKNEELEKYIGMISQQHKKESDIAKKINELKAKQSDMESKIKIDDHIKEKNIESELLSIFNTLKKKLEIDFVKMKPSEKSRLKKRLELNGIKFNENK